MKIDSIENAGHAVRASLGKLIIKAALLSKTPLAPDQKDFILEIHKGGGEALAQINKILDLLFISVGGGGGGGEKTSLPLQEDQSATGGPIILIIDDCPSDRHITSIMLKAQGMQSERVAQGCDAIKMLEKRRFDLLLLDCHMPAMNGFKIVSSIRDPHSAVLDHQVPIIAISADTSPDIRQRCIDAGMDDFLPKPASLQSLGEVMRWWIDNAHRIRPTPTA